MHSCFSPLLFVNLSKIGTPFFQEPSLGRERREGGRKKNGTDSIFSESVLTSDQRVLVLKRTGALQGEIPCVWNDKVASYPLSFSLTPLLMILIPLSSCVLSAALVICSLRDKNRDRLVFSEPLLVVRCWWLESAYTQIRAQSRLVKNRDSHC
jgi:hypothetical protein